MYAMMHIAIHDALNAIDRRSRPYAFDMQADTGRFTGCHGRGGGTNCPGRAHRPTPSEIIHQACIDAGVASVEAAYTAALAEIPDSPAKAQGIALGEASAAAILALRANDGGVGTVPEFQLPARTPILASTSAHPGTPFIAFEMWENVTPFVLNDSSQFRPGPPYAVTSKKYTADFDEVKSLGGDGKTTPSARTADQTEIALFWWESSPLKWNRIARTVSLEQGLDLWENARLFGLLNMALADGYIAMVAHQEPLQLLATGHRYSGWGHGRQSRHDWRPDVDTAARDSSEPGLRLGSLIEGGAGAEVLKRVLRHRPDQLPGLQRDVACRDAPVTVRHRAPLVYQLHPGGERERVFAHPHRVPLPQVGRSRHRLRPKDRQACRQSLPPACPLSRARGLTIRVLI